MASIGFPAGWTMHQWRDNLKGKVRQEAKQEVTTQQHYCFLWLGDSVWAECLAAISMTPSDYDLLKLSTATSIWTGCGRNSGTNLRRITLVDVLAQFSACLVQTRPVSGLGPRRLQWKEIWVRGGGTSWKSTYDESWERTSDGIMDEFLWQTEVLAFGEGGLEFT